MDGMFKIAMLLSAGGLGTVGSGEFDVAQVKMMAESALENSEHALRYLSNNGVNDVQKVISDLKK